VIAGDGAVFLIIGNIGIAIFSAANNASSAGVKDKFLAFEITCGDGKGNF